MKEQGGNLELFRKRKQSMKYEDEKIDRLFRDYSAATAFVSLDWRKMKIPPQSPACFIRHEQVFSRLCQWPKIPGPLSSWGKGSYNCYR